MYKTHREHITDNIDARGENENPIYPAESPKRAIKIIE